MPRPLDRIAIARRTPPILERANASQTLAPADPLAPATASRVREVNTGADQASLHLRPIERRLRPACLPSVPRPQPKERTHSPIQAAPGRDGPAPWRSTLHTPHKNPRPESRTGASIANSVGVDFDAGCTNGTPVGCRLAAQPSRTVTLVHWITSFRKSRPSRRGLYQAAAGLFLPGPSPGAHRPGAHAPGRRRLRRLLPAGSPRLARRLARRCRYCRQIIRIRKSFVPRKTPAGPLPPA